MSFERYNAGLANEIKNADFENESEIVNFVRSKLHRLWNVKQSKIKKLEKQNKILKEALEFYADQENWIELCIDGGISGTYIVDGDFVPCLIENVKYGYESARQALKKCKEIE